MHRIDEKDLLCITLGALVFGIVVGLFLGAVIDIGRLQWSMLLG